MKIPFQRSSHPAQSGGVTIMVALMLLVLLTVAALGMSRNSFREIVSSGFSRQGAMARNTADSGIEWSIHWIDLENGKVATGTALKMNALKQALLEDDTLAGVAKDITSADPKAPTNYAPNGTLQADLTLPSPASTTQGYTVGLTRMGKLPIANMSQGSGAGAFTPATGGPLKQAPDLWAVRSDAQLIQGGTSNTFIHAKEAWISTPVQ
jgi:Tfp pilus assembly protein PilX